MSRPVSLGPAFIWALAVALALGAAQGIASREDEDLRAGKKTGRSAELAFLILSTTSNHGEVEPCG